MSQMNNQHGFSLPETLFALLLFSLSTTALMQYQLALAKGFELQTQQRNALRLAWQRFEGYQAPEWRSELSSRPGPHGCQLQTANVTSPAGREAELTLLVCP